MDNPVVVTHAAFELSPATYEELTRVLRARGFHHLFDAEKQCIFANMIAFTKGGISGARSKLSNDKWRLEDHVCAVCFGRILSIASDKEGERVYRCADCAMEKPGSSTRVLCACGVKLKAKSVGIRCVKNATISPEFPFEIIAEQT